jgi:hypothetical protein
MVVVGPTLFVEEDNGSVQGLFRVPTAGGMLSEVTAFTSASDVAIDADNVYGIVTAGPCEIDRAPSAGGAMPSPFVNSSDLNRVAGNCPTALATDGTNVYWASSFSRNRNNDNGGVQVCVLSVGTRSASLAGPPVPLSSIEVDEEPFEMATDGKNVYVVTNASLWRWALDTGTPPVRIAGNLALSTACGGPNGGCTYSGCGAQSFIGLAVDDTSVYLAIGGPQGGSQPGPIYKIPK